MTNTKGICFRKSPPWKAFSKGKKYYRKFYLHDVSFFINVSLLPCKQQANKVTSLECQLHGAGNNYNKQNGVDGLFSLREGLSLEMSKLSRIRSSKLEDG